jgi:hypothetical protein
MATTIKSTDLDFQNIKTGLKNYFKSKSQFNTYDFEADGLNNILDVLAYNSHVNGLTANFALNEAFLNTAQLRSSVVSHAETLGYEVRSRTTSYAIININTSLAGVPSRPAQLQLPKGWTFTSAVNGVNYTFRTLENYFAKDNGSGFYQFSTADGSIDIPIYEGIEKTKTFLSGEVDERQIFVIPDETIDTATASVQVFDTASSSNYITYIPLARAVTIDETSTVFTIREAPNGFYELNFGDGLSFGTKPDAGNKVVVTYLSSAGPTANTADVFTSNSSLNVDGVSYGVNIVTSAESTAGANKQSIESVRYLAPIAYASQKRLVTSLDYKGTILSNYTDVTDANVWSGDQNVPIDYGSVYVSLNFASGTSTTIKENVKNSIVNNFGDRLGVVSINTKFTDPTDVYLEVTTEFDFDPALSGFTATTTENTINTFVQNYFSDNLATFNAVFRRSNLLTEIDALDQAILSSKMEIKTQMRITPSPGTLETFNIYYPTRLAAPDDVNLIVKSSAFTYNGVVAKIQNVLNSTRLHIVDTDGNELLDNIGQYNPSDGSINIIGLKIDGFIGAFQFLKISVTPENQSVVRPLRNYILRLDRTETTSTARIDRQTTSLQVT